MQSYSPTLAQIAAGGQSLQVLSGPTVPQTVRTLFVDRRNTLWVGTEGGYLYRLRDGAFVLALRVDDTADFISALFEDAQSNLWVGFSSGAGIGVLPQGDPARWHIIKGLAVPDVRAIAQASDGAMWFGIYYGGASRLKDGQLTNFTTRDGLSSDSVRCIHADPDGTVWLGTLHGLCRWRNGKFSIIDTADGLWNSCISDIEEDHHGNFWMSSSDGIFRVAREELNKFADGQQAFIQCIGYNRNDGLPSQECPGGFQPAGTRTPDGHLWFPTGGGLVSIDPNHIPQNKLVPPVYLEEVIVEGDVRPVPPRLTVLRAGPGKRRFEFRFTALSLTAPEKVRFSHKLEGLDQDWSKPDEHRTATYSLIPPGRYTFRVSACNQDGVWNPTGASMALVVKPFFWQTASFKVATVLTLALVLAWSGHRLERWKARLRFERVRQQHALECERVRIARDIHDDLGASLSQIVFFSERIDRGHDNPLEVEQWNRRIATAARSSIQSLDEIIWTISPKHDTIESLANYLTQFVQEYLTLAGVRCLLEVPILLPSMDINAEVRHNLLLATREAVQNIVAHAAASEVHLALQLLEDALKITIADNGRGFNPEQLNPNGNGLNNMRQRIEKIGGRLEIISHFGGGTLVRFSVPRTRFHFSGMDGHAGSSTIIQ
jgi:signal transduction histidine kinase/streptogramin lyase